MFPVPVPQAIMSSVCGASRANCLDAGGCAAPTLLATDSRPHSVSKAVVWVTFGASEFTAAGPRDRASVVSLPAKTVQITRRSRDFACTVKCPLLSASDDARAMRGHFINRIKTSRNDLTTVIPKPNEPVEVALRRFRRAIQNNGLIAELRARTAYEKPTTERKRKKAAAVARLRKQIRRAMPPRKLY